MLLTHNLDSINVRTSHSTSWIEWRQQAAGARDSPAVSLLVEDARKTALTEKAWWGTGRNACDFF